MRALFVPMLFLVITLPAQAAVVAPLTLDDLLERSDRVVRGVVLSSDAVLDEARGRIRTFHRVAVRETLKGEAADEVVVMTLGGETRDLGQIVPGAAHLPAGQDLVLCLRAAKDGFVVTGMAQGVFRVETDSGSDVLVRDLRGIHFLREPADGGPDRIPGDVFRRCLEGKGGQ